MEKQGKLTKSIFAVYLLLLGWLVLFKLATNPELIPRMRSLNLIPLAGTAVVNGKLYVKEIFLNVLAFVPLGAYLSVFGEDWTVWKRTLAGLGLSLAFEAAQYIFALGSSDVTDLIANSLGTLAGTGVYWAVQKCFREKAVAVLNGVGGAVELFAVGMAVLLVLANR